jgi:5-formyltetrahydrofolate cyclo-ligase
VTDLDQPTDLSDKDAWRRWAKAVRRQGIGDAVSRAVTAGVAEFLATARPGPVVLFLPLPDEVDVTPIMELPDREFVLTRTPADGPLTLHPADAPRERHRFGFEQPLADAPQVDPATVGVVLVPGLAFDRTGQRLGRGAGYYDTFLPNTASDVPRVAIVPSWLIVDAIPTEPHDVVMTHFATEHGVSPIRSAAE